MKTVIKIIFLIYYSINFAHAKLLLVHTLFRHGERTPDRFTMYPTDPFLNDTFYPYGMGQMTNVGKETMYNLGEDLRHRYHDLIREIYTPNVIDPWASSLPRTQMALQLVLASLLPPRQFQIWKNDLDWQPIPYNYLPKESDYLLLGILTNDFMEMYYNYCKSPAAKDIMNKLEPILHYIIQHAKIPGKTPQELFFLYITLNTEKEYGLKLPEWTNEVHPQPLADLIHLEFQLVLATKKLKQKVVGMILRKILEDTENVINGKSVTKMHLYSGHDVNIAYVLMTLDLMYMHSPGYGACLALEVHEEDGLHLIQAHYKDNKNGKFNLLKFPNGETMMSIEELKTIVSNIYDNERKSAANVMKTSEIRLQILFVMFLIYFI